MKLIAQIVFEKMVPKFWHTLPFQMHGVAKRYLLILRRNLVDLFSENQNLTVFIFAKCSWFFLRKPIFDCIYVYKVSAEVCWQTISLTKPGFREVRPLGTRRVQFLHPAAIRSLRHLQESFTKLILRLKIMQF